MKTDRELLIEVVSALRRNSIDLTQIAIGIKNRVVFIHGITGIKGNINITNSLRRVKGIRQIEFE